MSRTAMDSQFWDQGISSPRTLEGAARSIPGEPFPMEGSRASRALRIQQLSLLGNGFPLGIIPSYAPPLLPSTTTNRHHQLGSFSLQSLLLKLASSNCWLGLVGQFRPKKLFSSIKAELSNADELDFTLFKDTAKHILDKSLYSLGLSSQLSLSPSSSLLLTTERYGEKKTPRHKLMLFQQLPEHDITLEAAWPELFIDCKGEYWEVPESISLDLSSLPSDSGFRYRVGIHKNDGRPHSLNVHNGEAPSALLPGIFGKAAVIYEKSRDFWRRKETKEDRVVQTDKGLFWRPSYDVCLNEPHAAISGVIGGSCAAWFGGKDISASAITGDGNIPVIPRKRSPVNADIFGSVCYTYQHGRFWKLYGDLTRVDARVDICSGLAFAQRAFNVLRRSSAKSAEDPLSSPRLNLILQQQVAGPIVFRVDSKISLGSSPEKRGPHVEDMIYSLSYSLRLLRSGKVLAWYSPRRKEEPRISPRSKTTRQSAAQPRISPKSKASTQSPTEPRSTPRTRAATVAASPTSLPIAAKQKSCTQTTNSSSTVPNLGKSELSKVKTVTPSMLRSQESSSKTVDL